MALSSASTKSTGIVAASFGAVGSVFDDLQKFTILSAFPTETRDLVFDAMATYETALPASSVAETDYVGANAAVAGFADLCSYSRIMAFMKQAIAKAKTSTGEAPSSIFKDAERKAINALLGIKQDLADDDYARLGVFALKDMSKSPTAAEVLIKALPAGVADKAFDAKVKYKLTKDLDGLLKGLLSSNAAFKKRSQELLKEVEKPPSGTGVTPESTVTDGTGRESQPISPRIPNVVVSPN
jgi:hypothetical protein